MISYIRNGTYHGSQTTVFNSFLGSLAAPELKVVVLKEKEFTSANLKTLFDKKAYGVCVLLSTAENFVAGAKWREAYNFARIP